jgi:hypothetical protein
MLIAPPLPFGLSGCVTTAATSCPAASTASSVPTEKSGVPIKITLIYSPFPDDFTAKQRFSVCLLKYLLYRKAASA